MRLQVTVVSGELLDINRQKRNLSAGICPSSFFQTTTGSGEPETWHCKSTSEFCATTVSRGVTTNCGSRSAHTHTAGARSQRLKIHYLDV